MATVIVIAGGTGLLGRALVRRFRSRREPIRILARTAPRDLPMSDTLKFEAVDLGDAAAVTAALAGARMVIAAASGFGRRGANPKHVDFRGTLNLIQAARMHRTEHFVGVSVHGCRPDHPVELFRMKYAAEQYLRNSSVPWTILRPTAFMETWLEILGAPFLAKGSALIFGQGRNPINFVSAEDVAAFVERAEGDHALRGATVEIGGPENLSFERFIGRLSAISGRTGKIRRVPRPVLQAMSYLLPPIDSMIARMAAAALAGC